MSTRQRLFRTLKLSIFVKLVTMVTLINGVALGAMTLLATIFFHNEAERRVLENNLNIAEVVGSKIRSQLTSLRGMTRLMAERLEREGNKTDRTIFDDAPNNVMFALMEEERFIAVYNQKYLENNDLPEGDLQRAAHACCREALSGAATVKNISRELSVPLIAVAFSLRPGAAAIAVLDANEVVGSFMPIGLTRTIMVNSEGVLISSSDAEAVVSADVLTKIPIVEAMLKSPVLTGELLYSDGGVRYLGSFRKIDILGLGVISTVEADKIFEVVYDIQRRNILITLGILNMSFIVVYLFSRKLTAPIKELAKAMDSIKEGNFRVDLTPKSGDEIGRLTESLSSMATGLKERDRIKEAFGKFVNKEVAERIIKGNADVDGIRAQCVVFFSDLRNFTTMCETMDPEDVLVYLNTYFQEMVTCIHETGGVVDKFIGDAIMAHWGLLAKSENDVENAVNSALLMRSALADLNVRLVEAKYPPARFGCGINIGPVISGQIGSFERLELTIVGDAVNLASRIEALNKLFCTDILISQEAFDRVSHAFNLVKMPPVKVKGKSEAQHIYAVLGRRDDAHCPSSLEALRTRLGVRFDPEMLRAGMVAKEFEIVR